MKSIISMALLFFSFNLFADINWKDIKVGQSVKMAQELTLGLKKGQESFTVVENTTVKVLNRSYLPMIDVELYKVQLAKCSNKSAESEMELFDVVDANGRVITSGIELHKKCNLNIYVETTDLEFKSLFK